ncbi:MAG: radical SAM protein, partial [Candidatus Auribacterota bacterium]|nr:radical SAM protein [Candidatus Auribacterota bacterium]
MRDMINSNFMTAFLWDFIRQGLVVKTLQSPKLRKPVLNLALKIWQERIKKEGGKQAEDRYYLIKALVVTLQKALDNNISPSYLDGLTRIFAGKMVLGRGSPIQQKFKQRFGQFPPLFVLVCPTQNCNLKCTGCYTNSGGRGATLEPEIVDRIITETKTLWDSHFIVLSGGEPTLYPHLFQLAAKHRDTEFLMYTNGTLINEEFAEKLTRVGNIIPAISVEGFEKETDARRGEGVHAKILNAFANLRKVHVPFGISVTANRLNTDVITSDEFYDFYFEKEKVLFEWLFQYMPIGRAPTLDLMSTPEQRLKAREVKRRMERERNYFIGDFWNDGPGCNGCISAGRTGGYFNITGHGDCTACGFQPYAVANIREVYRNGGDLNTVFNSEFFQALRDWQNEYAYRKPAGERGDL